MELFSFSQIVVQDLRTQRQHFVRSLTRHEAFNCSRSAAYINCKKIPWPWLRCFRSKMDYPTRRVFCRPRIVRPCVITFPRGEVACELNGRRLIHRDSVFKLTTRQFHQQAHQPLRRWRPRLVRLTLRSPLRPEPLRRFRGRSLLRGIMSHTNLLSAPSSA